MTLLILSSVVTAAHSKELNWHTWSEQAFTQARQQDRLILVDLTAEWCMYCKKMDQTTYRDKAVIDEIERSYIAIKVDEAEFPDVAKRFSKLGRPGTIILDSDGNEILTKSGYIKPQWMVWMLQAVAQQASPEAHQVNAKSGTTPNG